LNTKDLPKWVEDVAAYVFELNPTARGLVVNVKAFYEQKDVPARLIYDQTGVFEDEAVFLREDCKGSAPLGKLVFTSIEHFHTMGIPT